MFDDHAHTHQVDGSGDPAGPSPAVSDYTVRVIHGTSGSTAQTEGMTRRAAIDKNTVNADHLWFGRVTCPPGLKSAAHHHGPAETAGHMLSGDRIRVYFGEGYKEYIEVRPGDYLFVPAWMPHIEMNMSDTESAEFVTARSPDNIVINIDEDDAQPEA